MPRRTQILFGLGCAAIVIGSFDPLEGSVLILLGSGLAALGAHLAPLDLPTRKYWMTVLLLNAVGVGELWQLIAFGGFGGNSGHSWWWGLLLLPYVAGWILAVGWIFGSVFRFIRGRIRSRRTLQP